MMRLEEKNIMMNVWASLRVYELINNLTPKIRNPKEIHTKTIYFEYNRYFMKSYVTGAL